MPKQIKWKCRIIWRHFCSKLKQFITNFDFFLFALIIVQINIYDRFSNLGTNRQILYKFHIRIQSFYNQETRLASQWLRMGHHQDIFVLAGYESLWVFLRIECHKLFPRCSVVFLKSKKINSPSGRPEGCHQRPL